MDLHQDAIQSQFQSINKSLERVERNVEKVSEGMIQLVEFRKEAEYLNQQIVNDRKRLVALEERHNLMAGDVSNHKTQWRIGVSILGFVGSASLAIGLFVAGANSKFSDKINEMDKTISIIQSVVTKELKQ
ncbi:hypothetical protein LITTLEDOG_57 [Serratia phage vB_SmaS_LittleDog]|uniref:Uncharacterized protein n=2 Tax=Bonzeevirus TaxID=3152507 RepID=A0A7T3NA40_9CAUD|nr:hypothetical protein QJS25_gp62 [Serratia phage vB_SmaS_Bonzee]YP_010774236.1 hypothetical protein QJS26_gp55 [Serratia phage vB_SmaS_Stoker]YP_010774373.1 hypothetical protein QJS28_gp60 [Serratia phage vB_SmaS_Bigdog]QPX75394.1 hypothetical protein [Serratia phage vB_SmaS_Opt-148]UGO51799.1 hypothetical protein SWAIN_57 [Serratia phage vB_SmaS_Swain]UGO51863.1 hypothetical protein CARROT_57 [Serratia phage vB_SmaS_Carrot]UGO53081.1 hypothetical protein LITTLEDOG_57 [Serratia phage vB_Sma